MAKTKTKQQEGLDLLEDPELLTGKAEEFFSDSKNRNIVFGVGGVIAIVVLAILGYKYYIADLNKQAQVDMFQAVYYFEADSLNKALNGDGINLGFLDVIDEYAGTDAANLAKFYAGAAYLKQGSYTSATVQLEDFSSNDLLLQARAYALAGDAYSELNNYDEAASLYSKAASYNPNDQFTPIYLVKLAVAYEANGEFGKAADAYDKIISKHGKSTFVQEAKKQKARLQGLAAE
ncbi:tol-pal system YbgF family protein [Marinoscillum sp. MHG1-6]|uniref:tetratricopeptide repeat protein n=1 Tax=Marinoscillum sp. MHG1-6 TaxID=2959627 RepID=UPI0021570E56|nr:tetratricopeptide repeat protein [Marinoscillum sp. MHG1-6]